MALGIADSLEPSARMVRANVDHPIGAGDPPVRRSRDAPGYGDTGLVASRLDESGVVTADLGRI